MVLEHLIALGAVQGSGSKSAWPVAVIGAGWVVAGIAMLVAPRRMFRIGMWSQSWMFAQRPEPSRRGLQVQRVIAVLAIPAGIAMVIFGLTHR